jgi:hypothetical protein
MKEIVIRAAAPGRVPGLAAKEDFRTLWEQKPADAGDMAYVDLKSLLSLLYDTGVPLLQTIAKKNVMEEVPLALDWALLPPSSRVVAHFRSMAAYSTWNRDGIAVSLQAPMPMLPMVAVAVGAAAYLATSGGKAEVRFGPAVEMEPPFAVPEPGMREPPKDLDAEMDRELARIQAEMLIEAADFFRLEKGRWPTSLAEVVEAGFMGAVPKDPWDGDYRLKTGEDGQTIVESAGPDQSFGTSDDVRAAK